MMLKEKIWIALLAVSVILVIWAGYASHFPGDVSIALFVQGITSPAPEWAKWITTTAKFPWNFVILCITVLLSWRLAGWRAALLALACFAGMWVVGKGLGPLVARLRPSPDLIHVAKKLSGYSFPSGFALTYASTIGFLAVLFGQQTSGFLRAAAIAVCSALLAIGWAARVALGAHWPSDVLLSYLIGLLWACFLVRFLNGGTAVAGGNRPR
jgi:membrane-associated phospholipid phosphatase